MATTHRLPHNQEDGPTLLFERQPPASRCHICPYRHVLENMSIETAAIPRRGILPLPQHHPDAATSPLPLPPLPGVPPTIHPAAPTPAAASPHPSPANYPGQTPAPSRPGPSPATGRPTLLPDPRGSGTLILPDALKPGGPEAATVARPLAAGDAPPHPSTPAAFDELASPDITVLQIPVTPPAPRPQKRRTTPDPRAFFVLNLVLGVLIVLGLLALAARALRPADPPATPEVHATP